MMKIAIIAGAMLISGAAFAATGNPTPNRSECGAAHAAAANQNGNFGFLGQVGGTPGYHDGATGQDPGATGSNNSSSTCNDKSPS